MIMVPSHIRLATARDAAQIQAIYAPNVRDTTFTFEVEPPSVPEMQARIVNTLKQFPWLVCEHEGEILGYAYASAHRARAAYQWRVEVSVYVRADARRIGVGYAVYKSLFALLRLQGFFNAYAGITLPNSPSVRLHETLGFRLIGVYPAIGYKLGAWRDVGWWHLRLQDCSGNVLHGVEEAPPPPIAFGIVQFSDVWYNALTCGELSQSQSQS